MRGETHHSSGRCGLGMVLTVAAAIVLLLGVSGYVKGEGDQSGAPLGLKSLTAAKTASRTACIVGKIDATAHAVVHIRSGHRELRYDLEPALSR